ncbi:MAG: PAS domain S-box protein [Bryobacteraceae bacterium]|nr:PAS domain S-box protein [Bryobacteraceae bacterium]
MSDSDVLADKISELTTSNDLWTELLRVREENSELRKVILALREEADVSLGDGAERLRQQLQMLDLAGSARNAKEGRKAEAALRESEERFSAAFAEAPVGMVLSTPEGIFIDANKAYVDMLGYSREELLSRTSEHFTHPEDVLLTSNFGEQLRQPGGTTAHVEKRYVRKDGQSIWVRASGTMRRDSAGTAKQIIVVIEDITERKRIEEALRLSEERLQQVFVQAPLAICLFRGPKMVFELANPRYREFYPGRELVGLPLLEAVPEINPDVLGILHRVLSTGETFVVDEFRFPLDRDSDGAVEEYWFNFVYHPLKEPDGTVSAIVALAVDVTGPVRARRDLERANRELEEFAFVASHDLQEPLRMVNIYTQLLMRKLQPQLNPATTEFADMVQVGVMRMEQLLKDLLNFSRITHGASQDTPTSQTADLNASLSGALKMLQSRTEAEKAVVTTDVLPVVRGQGGQLAQVFQSLISNSLTYRKPAEPARVHVWARQEGSEWIVGVSDNGIGFEQNQAKGIFGLFRRLHKDEYPGTGIGLAICKRIVERYGGRIWAESRLGQGSTFFFALPGIVGQK